MTDLVKHATPRPWHYDGDRSQIVDAAGQPVPFYGATQYTPAGKAVRHDEDPLTIAMANDALVVRAVNCHETLLEACRRVIETRGRDAEAYNMCVDAVELAEGSAEG
jgi:hypothetical protein